MANYSSSIMVMWLRFRARTSPHHHKATVPGVSALSICTGSRSFLKERPLPWSRALFSWTAALLHGDKLEPRMRLPRIIMIHFPDFQSFGYECHSYWTDDKVTEDKPVREMIPSQYRQDACAVARASPQITPAVGATLYYDFPRQSDNIMREISLPISRTGLSEGRYTLWKAGDCRTLLLAAWRAGTLEVTLCTTSLLGILAISASCAGSTMDRVGLTYIT